MVAMPPPSQSVKPITWTNSQRPRMRLPPYHFGNGLPTGIPGSDVMPVVDPVFARFPAPVDLAPVELAVEVHEPHVEPLEHAADLLQLEQGVVDAGGDVLHGAPQRELLLRFAPIGLRLGSGELVAGHQLAPLRVQGADVGDDPLDEGKGAVGFGESEILRHGNNLATKTGRRTVRRGGAQLHSGCQVSVRRKAFVCVKLGYLTPQDYERLDAVATETAKTLWGLRCAPTRLDALLSACVLCQARRIPGTCSGCEMNPTTRLLSSTTTIVARM